MFVIVMDDVIFCIDELIVVGRKREKNEINIKRLF